MKLTIRHTPASGPYWDNASPYEAIVETEKGRSDLSIHEGEPEDMTFGRNLSGIFNLPKLIKEAYEAGKRGEELEIKEEEYDW